MLLGERRVTLELKSNPKLKVQCPMKLSRRKNMIITTKEIREETQNLWGNVGDNMRNMHTITSRRMKDMFNQTKDIEKQSILLYYEIKKRRRQIYCFIVFKLQEPLFKYLLLHITFTESYKKFM
jgi:hypothetical protein